MAAMANNNSDVVRLLVDEIEQRPRKRVVRRRIDPPQLSNDIDFQRWSLDLDDWREERSDFRKFDSRLDRDARN
jgi:hypothetical protein